MLSTLSKRVLVLSLCGLILTNLIINSANAKKPFELRALKPIGWGKVNQNVDKLLGLSKNEVVAILGEPSEEICLMPSQFPSESEETNCYCIDTVKIPNSENVDYHVLAVSFVKSKVFSLTIRKFKVIVCGGE